MNNNLLEQLRPIIYPGYEISVWPLAIGWWILIGLILTMIVGFIFLRPILKSRRQQKQIRKHTQQLLNTLYLDCKNKTDVSLALQDYLQKSNDIFKRIVHNNPQLSHFSHLVGNDWATFISRADPKSPFAKLYGDNLYAPRCKDKINLQALHDWACTWVILAGNKIPKEISP